MSLLKAVAQIRADYLVHERALAEAIITRREAMRVLSEEMDTAMVYAVDWGSHSPTEVALVAGYKSHAAVRDARKRIEKREAGVR